MNAPALPKVQMTIDEFLSWAQAQPEGRYELVGGRVVAMSPEQLQHNLVKLDVAVALREAIRAANLPCTVFTDGATVAINDHTAREPDASVQCGHPIDPYSLTLEAPLIVVEVVSPSSERSDSGAKLVDYFSVASVQHYLIIHPERRTVVHHQRNGHHSLNTKIASPGEHIVLNPPGFTVAVAALLGPLFATGGETGS